jgi:hypothetical protein
MADVTATFAAKDQGVAAMIQRLENKLSGFQTRMGAVSASAKRMQSSFSNLGRSVIGLAAAYVGVTQAISAFNKAMDFGGRMNDLSEITGESAGNLAVLERAFDNTGVGGEKMMPMLAKMTEFIQQLEKGQGEAVATASKLGVTFADLKNKTPIERFQTLLRAVAGLTNENNRLNASQDVFGTRIGGRLIPLINNFSAEMAAASKQLGSVVEILNRNSSGIDEFGDRVQKAIAAKPMEFMLGFLDEMTGRTQNLAKAISEIDTAAAGQNFAKMFSGAMKDPGIAFTAFGEKLLVYAMKAGNMLVDAVVHAGTVWQKYLTDPGTQKDLTRGFILAMEAMINWGNKAFYSTLKTAIGLINQVTGGMVPFAKETMAELDKLGEQLGSQSARIREDMSSAMGNNPNRFLDIARNTPKQQLQTFDVAAQEQEATAAFNRLRQLAEPESKADQFFKQLNQIYQNEVEAIHASTQERVEQLRRLETLQAQYKEKAAEAIRALGEPSTNLAPPQLQMQQNAMPQATREEMARQSSASFMPATAQEEVASEPTLQKAVDLLAELNTKLPQPVLA